ncbi:MAG: WcaF family extracellular polysaccharide biosynthesis acetyltransferase [Chitinophagales bacterium]
MRNQVSNENYNNDWFKREIGASRLKQIIWYFTNVFFFINPMNPGSGNKRFLLRLFGAKIGKGVVLKPSINIKYPWKLSIGDFSWIGEKVWIDNLGQVDIGKNVCISQGAMLLTGNHDYTKQRFDLMIGKIVLEDGVWIGAKAMVCPGVSCETHSVLAAHSVATQNLSAHQIYQGNPARAVKERVIQ